MELKKRIQRFLKRLPVIGPLKKELAEQKRLNQNSERYIHRMMEQRRDLSDTITDLEAKVSAAEARVGELAMDNATLENTERLLREDVLTLNRNMAEKHAELRAAEKQLAVKKEEAVNTKLLEAKVEEARKGFAIFEKFKQFAQNEYWALHEKHDALEKRYAAMSVLFEKNAEAFCEDHALLARTLRSVDRLKGHVRFALGAAKEYKYGANEYAMDMLAETLERAGISALIFDEEKVIYSTSYVGETIGTETDLVGACFSDVFDCDNIEAFSELGPQHPLTTKKGKQFAGILFSFVTGHDKNTGERKHYRTIWLIGDRKIGLSEYFRGNEVAMPRNITAEYARRVVGGHLNDRIGRFGKSTKLAINCSSSYSLDIEAADYLARVAVSSSVKCEIEIRNPCKSVYDALVAAHFPEDRIKGYSPKKKGKDVQIGSKAFGINFAPA